VFIHFFLNFTEAVASVASMDATPLNTFITIKGSHTNKRYMVSYKMTQKNSSFIPISYLTYKANRDTIQQLPAGLSKIKILVDQQKFSGASNTIQNFSSQLGQSENFMGPMPKFSVVGLPGPAKFYHWPGMLKYKNKMAI
jgi:hypothetical protein